MTRPIVIAHRGASAYLPEHTLAGKALAHSMGADYLEQDVVLTRDSVPIVLHDIYLEPTTDVAQRFPHRARADKRYYAADFELLEIRQLKVHERSQFNAAGNEVAVYPSRFPLESGFCGIPTLSEEIDFIAGLDHSTGKTTGLYIEFKAPNWHRKQGLDIVDAVLRVLKEKKYHDKKDQVFLQCFDDSTLKRLHTDTETTLPLIQLIGDNSWNEDSDVDYKHLQTQAGLEEVARYASGIGPWIMQLYVGRAATGEPLLSPLASMAQALDLKVHPYTLRRDELPEGIDRFEDLLDIFINQLKVDGLFTDFPDLARQYIDRMHN
ncbi:MAG: glycerophosphodiester phosphodiesterase [Halioglobus sp.]